MILYYLRHGDPIYDPDSLTELGKIQADALSKRLAIYGLDEIYSSTSRRAYETALPTAKLLNKEIKQIEFFHERHAASYFMVEYEKGKVQWLENIPKYREIFISNEIYELGEEWYKHPKFKNNKFEEGIELLKDKIDDFMLSLGFEHNRKMRSFKKIKKSPEKIAIFAHAGFGGVFLSSILDIPYPTFVNRHEMSHTGMTVIEFSEKNEIIIPRILQYSNDSHLYKEGVTSLYNNRLPV